MNVLKSGLAGCCMSFLLLANVTESAELLIQDAWVSKPLTEHTNTVAAFAVIANDSEEPVTIEEASSDYADKVQLHQIVHEDGVVRMRLVPTLTIQPGDKLRLHEGGYHLMLLDLNKELWTESSIDIQLHLSTGEHVEQNFDIRGLDQSDSTETDNMMGHHHH